MKNSIIKLLLSSVCIFIVFGVIVFASEQPAVNIEVDENNNSSIEISNLSFDVYSVQLELIVDKSNSEYKFTANNKNSYSLLTQEASGSKTKLTIYLDSNSVLNSENKINVGNIFSSINPNFSVTGKLILLNEKLKPTEYDDMAINIDYSNTTTDSEDSTESTSKESTETTTGESTETTTSSNNNGGSSSSSGGGGGSSLGRYKITAEAKEGGNIEPKGDIYISRGTNKVFTFVPNEGYAVDNVKVNDISVNIKDNTYTIESIKSNMSIIVSFKKSNEKEPSKEDKNEEVSQDKDEKFSDVNNHWAKDAIYYLTDKGIVNGITENIFAPNNNITRAEFVTLLAKTAGIDIYNYSELPFKDVIKNDWYASFVAWAYENEIVKGIDNETFSPKLLITREQMAVMICNYMSYANIEAAQEEKTDFRDSNLISDYAANSVKKVHYAGIISGKDNYMFAPKENATRAESATIIYNLIK